MGARAGAKGAPSERRGAGANAGVGGNGAAAAGANGSTGDGGTGPAERVEKVNPSFAQDIVEITRGCAVSGCHGSGAGRMTLGNAATTYGAWVNVASAGELNEVLVIPGDAENSYVVKKLEGRQMVGFRMPPFDMSPLDAIDLANIRNWIDQGALNN